MKTTSAIVGAVVATSLVANAVMTEATIRSRRGRTCRVRYRDKMITLDTKAGQSYPLNGELKS